MNRYIAKSRAALIALAISLPFLSCGLQWLLWDAISPFVWFLFFPTVFFSAWLGGMAGGLPATVLSATLVWYVFIPPQLSWSINNPNNIYSVGLFIIMGCLFNWVFTLLRKANQQLQDSNEKISVLYEKTKEIDTLKNQFFANVSHELRTPLALILGPIAKWLKNDALNDETRRDLEIVERNARLLHRHVNDLLDVSKLEAGQMTMTYVQTDLAHQIRMLASHFSLLAEERQIDFNLHLENSLPAQVDPEKLHRIVLNLLSNAFKFTPDGGSITISLQRVDDKAVIRVTDNGIGIPPDKREIIFEAFRQADGSSNRSYGGTGLGLSIAKEFTELHGGTITAGNGDLGGAEFTVSLPCNAPADTEILAEETVGSIDELSRQTVDELHSVSRRLSLLQTDEQRPVVLVVEDNADMNQFICRVLQPHFRVLSAWNGNEGLQSALENRPDLILSDVMMPGMSGDVMVAELKRHRELRDTPVIMLTAKADDELQIQMISDGAQDYIRKPFLPEELLARISVTIGVRQESQAKLRASENRYRTLVDSSPDMIAIHQQGIILFINKAGYALLGASGGKSLIGRNLLDFILPEERELMRIHLGLTGDAEILRTPHECRLYREDDTAVDVEIVTTSTLYDGIDSFQVTARDITVRKEMERALQEKISEIEGFFSNCLTLLCIADTAGRFIRLNPEWEYVLGYSLSEMEGTEYVSYVHPDDVESTVQATTQLAGQSPVLRFTNRYRTKNGDYRILEWMSYPLKDRIYAAARDITQQKQDELMLRESRERLELAVRSANMGIWSINLQEDKRSFDDHVCHLLGIDPANFKGTREEFYNLVHPDDRDRLKSAMSKTIATGDPYAVEYRVIWPDGSLHHLASRGKIQKNVSKISDSFFGVIWDVSEQKNVEEKIAQLMREQTAILDNAPVGISLIRDRRMVWVNKQMETIFQYSKEELEGETTRKFYLSDEAYEKLGIDAYPFIAQGHPYETVRELVRHDGSRIWARYNGAAIEPKDPAKGTIWILDDITSRMEAESEKEKLQAQLNQAQKLDTVGRLAGGIAHDFNNKLSVIMGYAELSQLLQCGNNKECSHNIDEILLAAQHAQEITRRLLTFSRNDTVNPLILDLNAVLTGIRNTLGRMIGEQINILIELQQDLWLVKIDPTQFDQMVTNLVINARDAMPHGGDVTLATKNSATGDPDSGIPPGEYVVLSCRDTGSGMDDNTLNHLFEPFFTTKEVGKGTGLGLASVYGIVKQNSGYITVQSQPGKGSSFSIYLPRAIDSAASQEQEPRKESLQGKGTILIVEDEEPVRKITSLMLEKIGYRVIAAETPEQAVGICGDQSIVLDCIITDIIMPGMNGKEFQKRIAPLRPAVPCIFMSGYTADNIKTHLYSTESVEFMQKPINYKLLNDKISQLIRK